MKDYRNLLKLGKVVTKVVAENVIDELRSCRECLLGDDSCLKNVWEEICVQVQGEKPVFWKVYVLTMNEFIKAELDLQQQSVKELLGFVRQLEDDEMAQPDRYYEDAAIDGVRRAMLAEAKKYKNIRIKAYLDPHFMANESKAEEDQE